MPKSKDYEMAIKIAGEIEKSFLDSTKLTKKELQEIARQGAHRRHRIRIIGIDVEAHR